MVPLSTPAASFSRPPPGSPLSRLGLQHLDKQLVHVDLVVVAGVDPELFDHGVDLPQDGQTEQQLLDVTGGATGRPAGDGVCQ